LSDVHIQSLARDLMYPINPAFLPGGLSRITPNYSPSDLTSQVLPYGFGNP